MTSSYNADDSILAQENSMGYPGYSPIDESDILKGVLGFITVKVDSKAVYEVSSYNCYAGGDVFVDKDEDSTRSNKPLVCHHTALPRRVYSDNNATHRLTFYVRTFQHINLFHSGDYVTAGHIRRTDSMYRTRGLSTSTRSYPSFWFILLRLSSRRAKRHYGKTYQGIELGSPNTRPCTRGHQVGDLIRISSSKTWVFQGGDSELESSQF